MAQEITASDVLYALRQRFGFRGSTDFQLEENIIPVASIGNLQEPPYHFKRGGVVGAAVPNVAAQFSYWRLKLGTYPAPDPAFMNAVVVIRKLVLWKVAAGPVFLSVRTQGDYAGVAFSDSSIAGSWDSRPATQTSDNQRPMALTGAGNSATDNASGINGIFIQLQAGIAFTLDFDWVLRQGNHLVVQDMTLNEILNVSCLFDEYQLA